MERTIIVTGAGRGLGYSIARKHLDMEDRVYAMDYNLTDELRSLAEASEKLSIYQCDIGSTESVAEAVKDVLAAGRQLNIIYNVAGIYRFEDKTGLEHTDLDAGLHMFNVNALGALRICKAVWPLIQKGTLVVNISSEAGSIGGSRRKQEYCYCMSKAALNMGAKILSNELWDRSARVINFHPGWLRTPMGGPGAFASKHSVSPDESAENIVNIAVNIDEVPRDQMFMTHTGDILPW
ncbi:MAG TPA: SDR family NAD(P)-dependent oxidoreductase [Clostridiales bacterium]|nr:SDR family NAD(P)-dependent oxidoreductase [Clostridiales bacterium]HPV00882.1 SDR family NAD(P)-dependent oxidoreductase [Clostridiales bacterium]